MASLISEDGVICKLIAKLATKLICQLCDFFLVASTTAQLFAISSDTSVGEGQTAILACVGYSEPNVEVTWWRNGRLVTNSDLISTSQFIVSHQGRNFTTSFLQICGVGNSDVGEYTCMVSNSIMSVTASVQLTIAGQKYVCVADQL